MKNLFVVPAVLLSTLSVHTAAIDGVNIGPAMGTGPSSSHYSISAAGGNPAMAPLMVPEDEKWRISYLPSITTTLELGDVSNFADDLDELIDLIEDPSTNQDSAEETLDRFNDVLVRMGQNGYIKNAVNLSIPVTPGYYFSESLGGTFFLDINYGALIGLQVLDDVLRLDEQNQSFTTDTSVYVKSGIETRVSFGYGQQIWADKPSLKDRGKLYAGATLNLIKMELSKQVTRLEDLDGEEVSDVIRDEYDKNLESSTNIGIDLGLVWDADWYRVGLHLDNLLAPSFDYGNVGVDCESRPQNTVERNSCEIARSFVADGRLKSSESHTMHEIIRVDGLLKLTDRWHVSGALDLAEYDDIVGFANQWMNFGMNYETKSRFIPSPRIGYQTNLAGSEVSSYTFGFSILKSISLDFEWGTESVEVDGDSAPRRFGFSLAFEESF